MTTPSPVLSGPVLAPQRGPSWVARNAKFMWAAASVVLTVLTDVVNAKTAVVPPAWLPLLHLVILGLTAAGVQRDTNAMGIEQVVRLVQHVLPGHKLVALPAPSTVLDAPVVVPTTQPTQAASAPSVVVTMPAEVAPDATPQAGASPAPVPVTAPPAYAGPVPPTT